MEIRCDKCGETVGTFIEIGENWFCLSHFERRVFGTTLVRPTEQDSWLTGRKEE